MQNLFAQIAKGSAVSVALPFPPSVNAMYFNAQSGRVSSQAYQKWQRECGKLLKGMQGAVQGEYIALILVERHRKNSDIDNRIKACLDVLVKHKITGDDCNCIGVNAFWLPKSQNCQAYIYIFTTAESFLASFNIFYSNQNLALTLQNLERTKHIPDFKLNLNFKLTKENTNGLCNTH
jgi:Holliday junction resolvase RusA-like endonuclease